MPRKQNQNLNAQAIHKATVKAKENTKTEKRARQRFGAVGAQGQAPSGTYRTDTARGRRSTARLEARQKKATPPV